MQHLAGLNPKQKEAAIHTKGPLLIVAGAGAGKTKTITHRIVNLIKNGVAPERILAVTFTNKAAKEMRERIREAILRYGSLWEQDCEPFVSTFHSLGVYIIKENARILGLTKYFTILDEQDSTSLIKEALKELGDPCKSILTQFYYEQFSMEMIAEKFGYTNSDTAKTQKYKCLKRLKTILSKKMKGYLTE